MNYFNYFTETEEHFQRARQSGLFLLSPLDWALIETWKDAGVPLAAVLKGIDRAFEKWHARKRRFHAVNSVAYCTQEVLQAAREMAEGGAGDREAKEAFSQQQLADYFRQNAETLRALKPKLSAGAEIVDQTIQSLEDLTAKAEAAELTDLEVVEQRLTVMEERLVSVAAQAATEEKMLQARQEMDRELAAYRGKMTADQISMLERQYLQRRALEDAELPRLSLFYLQ